MSSSRRHVARATVLWLAVSLAAAQDPTASDGPSPVALDEPPAVPANEEAVAPPESDQGNAVLQNRTTLNLLGEADTAAGESRRNENRQITLVDNNAAQELNQRVGTTATITEEFQPDLGYFTSEYGTAPRRPIHVSPQSGTAIHGNLFWNHDNSAFRARSFFQVGAVKPARSNQYGGAVGLDLWPGSFMSVAGSQSKIRGNVNGNVLIPLPEERTPLTNDPVLRPIVQRYLNGYPNIAPNRPDIAARALNTNSLQVINTDTASGQLTQNLGERDKLAFQYAFTAQRVDAFQLVVGQNPDSANQSHRAGVTWNRVWSPLTVTDASVGFDRQNTRLVAAEGAVGPLFVTGLTTLGPFLNIPLRRVQNRFRYSFGVRQQRGNHALRVGFGAARFQYNSDEPDGARGAIQFAPDFGRDGITNLRLGTPNRATIAIGDTYRAFRNWEVQAYAGDRWQVHSRLALNFGVRWEPITRPFEVTGRSNLPFDSDWNNFGGSFGFSYRLPGNYGVVHGAYGLMYGQIFPVTYGQDRLNLPYNLRLITLGPDLRNLGWDVDPDDIDPNARSSRYDISPNLATPYSHQYNLAWEGELGAGWRLQLGYAGSRSHKLFFAYTRNRAVPVEGIPLTTSTVNERRPDQNVFEQPDIHNGSRSYYDAGRVTVVVPRWGGFGLTASYWFSKAMDIGANFTATGSGNASFSESGQSQDNVHADLKALTDFDQPHALLVQANYQVGQGGGARGGWLERVYRNWNVSSVVLLKNGTPFTMFTGSDAPGVGNVDGTQGDRPMVLDPSILGQTVGDPDMAPRLLPRSAFRFIQAPGETRGNIGRNTFRRGKIANVNAAVSRTWALPREWQMTFRAQSVNFFNTPQFAEPGNSLLSPNFGQITNTLNDGRTFEFSLRLAF
jgi:hypothetical protein